MLEGKSRTEIFGENLDRILKEQRVSRTELATALKISTQAIYSYIHGIKQPSFDKIFRIADYLQVSVSSLVGDNEYNNSYPNIEAIILNCKYSHALEVAFAANFDIEEYSNGFIVSIPAIFQHVEDDGTISAVSGFESYKISDQYSLVRIMELSEMQAIKLNKPIAETFKNIMVNAKKIE